MPDRPTHDPGSPAPDSGASDGPNRSLSEILEELAILTGTQQGEASAMRGAVSELSRALARLFEMIRADRAAQHTRIAELEEGLAQAEARIRELETASVRADPAAPPGAADFDALRGAAERLRLRTAELVREAGTPEQERAKALADREERERAEEAERAAEEARVDAARRAVEASLAEDEALAARRAPGENGSTPLPVTPSHDEPFDKPGILRVFPGAVLPATPRGEFDVESDLDVDEPQLRQAVAHAVPTVSPPSEGGGAHATGAPIAPADREPEGPPRGTEHHADGPFGEAGDAGVAPAEPGTGAPEAGDDRAPGGEPAAQLPEGQPTLAPPTGLRRPQPISVAPRPARRRRRSMRRRRIDARRLAAVDAAAALRALVGAIDQEWTAGAPLDLVIAMTDGGTLHVTGGEGAALRVAEVQSGTSARSTITATSAQVLPLFGRLDLTDEQSAPLIHGTRHDADLLVGWIDRAQRLEPEPL